MKVLLLNTFKKGGGAAIASKRLVNALKKNDVEVTFGFFYPDNESDGFLLFGSPIYNKLCFLLERLGALRLIRKMAWLFKFSPGIYGVNITKHPKFLEADVVHLHWVNFGFLSIRQIGKLSEMKPLVMTLHDMWAFTGGCHYSHDCVGYQGDCKDCFYLRSGLDTASNILAKKQLMWSRPFGLITCSSWMESSVRKSKLMSGWPVQTIGNTLDIDLYQQLDQLMLRSKYQLDQESIYVLSGAMDLEDERKGFKYFQEAVSLIRRRANNIKILTFGKGGVTDWGVESISFGSIHSERELVEIYNLADVFVLPSIQDNLPNTVMEAMACGVPVVAFDCGGVTDMVEHKVNGYLAENRNAGSLAEGICYFMDRDVRNRAGKRATMKIMENYAEDRVTEMHLAAYRNEIERWKEAN